MPARHPSRRSPRRSAPLAWVAVSLLALTAFVVVVDTHRLPASADAARVVPVLK